MARRVTLNGARTPPRLTEPGDVGSPKSPAAAPSGRSFSEAAQRRLLGDLPASVPTATSPNRSLTLLDCAKLTLGVHGKNPNTAVPPRYLKTLRAVLKSGAGLEQLSDDALRDRFSALAAKRRTGAPLETLVPSGFAIVKEACRRSLGMVPYDVQILGAIALVGGNIAEMGTGEGKTLTAALAAALFALDGRGVHVVTTSQAFAERDVARLSPLYQMLGLEVAFVDNRPSPTYYEDKREAYAADVTYADKNTVAFDAIEDQTWWKKDWRVQRGRAYAIVDEADDILLDTAVWPLVFTGPNEAIEEEERQAEHERLHFAKSVVDRLLPEEHLEILVEEEKTRAMLTERGYEVVEQAIADRLGIEADGQSVWSEAQVPWLRAVLHAIEARYTIHSGRDFVGEVMLIDEATGRPRPGASLRHGLHDAARVEADLTLEAKSSVLSISSYQHAYGAYEHLCGMTATAGAREREFRRIYGCRVVKVPTNQPVRRVDLPDRVFPHPAHRLAAALADALERQARGQPVLISAIDVGASIEVSRRLEHPPLALVDVALSSEGLFRHACGALDGAEKLATKGVGDQAARSELAARMLSDEDARARFAELLESRGLPARHLVKATSVPHQLFNADNAEAEESILLRAGERGTITVATQIAGRASDIILAPGVEALGGLHVIGLEHKTNARKDHQLRGRAGRQGQVGSSRFYVTPADACLSNYPARLRRKMAATTRWSRIDEGPGARRELARATRYAQRRIEHENELRREVSAALARVIEHQRETIAAWRDDILERTDLVELLKSSLVRRAQRALVEAEYVRLGHEVPALSDDEVRDMFDAMARDDHSVSREALTTTLWGVDPEGEMIPTGAIAASAVEPLIGDIVGEQWRLAQKMRRETQEESNQYLRDLILFCADRAWSDHLQSQEILRDSAFTMAGGEDPWAVYSRRASGAFRELMRSIDEEVLDRFCFHLRSESEPKY